MLKRFWAKPYFWSVLLTIIFLWPLLTNITSQLYSHDDGLFIAWTIDQVATKISSGQNIYQLPILSGIDQPLTFSDPFLPTALLSLPLKLFTNNIILIHNIHLILGCIATFIGFYFLANYLFKDHLASISSAIFFTFSPLHLKYLVHLHTFLIAGIPFSILFFLRWIKNQKFKDLTLALLFFLYQFLNAPMTGFFLSFIFLILILFEKNIRQKIFQNWKKLFPIATLGVIILTIVYQPYFSSAQIYQSQRSIRDAAHFSANLESLLSPIILVISSFIFFISRQQKKIKQPVDAKTFLVIALTGAILMLGPVLKINNQTVKVLSFPIPLPYAIFYYIIPGFKAFRASSRWIVLLNFGLSLLLASQLARTKKSNKFKFILIITLTLTLFIFQLNKYPMQKINSHLPTIYQELKYYPNQTLLELPAYTWDIQPLVAQESDRLLYQSIHQTKLFNGTSGYIPNQREKEFHLLTTNFPDQATLKILDRDNVKLIIIHFDQYQKLEQSKYFPELMDQVQLRDKLEATTSLDKVSCWDNDCLFLINEKSNYK